MSEGRARFRARFLPGKSATRLVRAQLLLATPTGGALEDAAAYREAATVHAHGECRLSMIAGRKYRLGGGGAEHAESESRQIVTSERSYRLT